MHLYLFNRIKCSQWGRFGYRGARPLKGKLLHLAARAGESVLAGLALREAGGAPEILRLVESIQTGTRWSALPVHPEPALGADTLRQAGAASRILTINTF